MRRKRWEWLWNNNEKEQKGRSNGQEWREIEFNEHEAKWIEVKMNQTKRRIREKEAAWKKWEREEMSRARRHERHRKWQWGEESMWSSAVEYTNKGHDEIRMQLQAESGSIANH